LTALHSFLFTPGLWLGEGSIALSSLDEELIFYTRWMSHKKDKEGKILCVQEIEIKGLSDIMQSEYCLFAITETEFSFEMDNSVIGKVQGKGFVSPESISWEIVDSAGELEGVEFYQKESKDLYQMRADYATSDQFRTEIKGKIWRKEEVK